MLDATIWIPPPPKCAHRLPHTPAQVGRGNMPQGVGWSGAPREQCTGWAREWGSRGLGGVWPCSALPSSPTLSQALAPTTAVLSPPATPPLGAHGHGRCTPFLSHPPSIRRGAGGAAGRSGVAACIQFRCSAPAALPADDPHTAGQSSLTAVSTPPPPRHRAIAAAVSPPTPVSQDGHKTGRVTLKSTRPTPTYQRLFSTTRFYCQ